MLGLEVDEDIAQPGEVRLGAAAVLQVLVGLTQGDRRRGAAGHTRRTAASREEDLRERRKRGQRRLCCLTKRAGRYTPGSFSHNLCTSHREHSGNHCSGSVAGLFLVSSKVIQGSRKNLPFSSGSIDKRSRFAA